ncbi:MAG: hypothetical protein ACO1NW_00375 [Chitinophagaceae bacterium]
MTKRLKLLLCLSITYFNGISQSGPPIPTSPSAASFSKTINYPVNLNTGVPGISIPIGKIEAGGGLELPVELNYHAGGFKVNERSGNTGLGWSISTDLQITRSINGIDDFGIGGYISNTDILPYDNFGNGSFQYSKRKNFMLANGERDGTPDKFNFKLLNKSGSFYFQKNANGYAILPVPYDNIRIEYMGNRFIITDTDGTRYFFGNAATSWDIEDIDVLGYELTNEIITSWKCVRIEDYTGNNYLIFSYSKKPVEYVISPKDRVEYYNNISPCSITAFNEGFYSPQTVNPPSPYYFENLLSEAGNFYKLPSPKTIEYFNGHPKKFTLYSKNQTNGNVEKAEFDYYNQGGYGLSASILGLNMTSITFRGGSVSFVYNDVLSTISFKDHTGGTVRYAQFIQSFIPRGFSDPTEGTHYLDEVIISGSNSTYSPEKYTLLYKSKVYFGGMLKGHDAWGYRNAWTMDAQYASMVNYPGLTPYNKVTQDYFSPMNPCWTPQPNLTVEVGNMSVEEYPNETYMSMGMLKRIIQPTGGFVDFDFEVNRYNHGMGFFKPLLCAGGLRIQKITYYDADSPPNKPAGQKYYVYGDLETGDGVAAGKPSITFGYGTMDYGTHKFTQNIIYAHAQDFYWPIEENGVRTYWIVPCSSYNCLRIKAIEQMTTFQPSSARDLSYSNGSPIYYSKVTEYQQDYGQLTGKKVTEFYPYNTFSGENLPALPTNMIEGTDVRYLSVDWHVGALKSVSDFEFKDGNYTLVDKKEYEYSKFKFSSMPRVVYCFLKNIWRINSSVYNFYTEASYDAGPYGAFPTDINADFIAGQYGIAIGKLLLSKEKHTFRDPANNTYVENSVDYFYDQLPYIKPTRLVTSNSKQQQITTTMVYPFSSSGNYIYGQMVSRNMIDPVVERVQVLGLDQEISRRKVDFNFVFGHNFIAPSAEYESHNGSALEQVIAYDQYDEFGNLLQTTGRDGLKQSFLYGYHKKYPVAVLKGVPFETIPNSITASSTLVFPESDNELHTLLEPLYGLNSQSSVSTFAYRPFMGVTSISDANGLIKHFEYDNAGRLSMVKDHQGNILSKNEMVYRAPSQSAFNLFNVNKPVMGTYNEAYCNPLFTYNPGSGEYPKNYIVPGGSVSGSAAYPVEIDVDDITNNGMGCLGSNLEFGTIRLCTFLFLTLPSKVYVDFIKDGHVFATYKFMYNSSNTNFRDIKLPPGDYKVSFRPDAEYKGELLKYRFYNLETQINYWVETGSSISVQNGKSYELEVVNISGANYPTIPYY